MNDNDLGDRALVARAASGSEWAFRTLYRRNVEPVYWIALRLLGRAADAEEVAQETFVTAWQKLPRLRLEGESVLPWLATICRFHAANRRRSLATAARRHAEWDDTTPAGIDVEQQVIDAETVSAILAEVSGLSGLDQRIFRLCAAEGYSYEAAAAELGVTHGAVRNRLSRIRTRVRTSTGTDPS